MSNASSRIVIAVDGLSATGKTTLSKLLAERLNFSCLHSGLIYRAVAYLADQEKVKEPYDPNHVLQLLSQHQVAPCDGRLAKEQGVLIDGQLVSAKLRMPHLSEMTSKLSALPELRQAVFDMQRNAFASENLVAEGRDMGTVVFPDAKVKFFVKAAPAVRARRRLAEIALTQGSEAANLLEKELEKEIAERDFRDQNRAVAPAVPASDAIIIDNSSETLTQVIERMYEFCRKSLDLPARS